MQHRATLQKATFQTPYFDARVVKVQERKMAGERKMYSKTCTPCKGSGVRNGGVCSACKGNGKVHEVKIGQPTSAQRYDAAVEKRQKAAAAEKKAAAKKPAK